MFDAASLFWAEAIIASTRQARAKRKGPKLRSRARIAGRSLNFSTARHSRIA
jgi:hypothetical protein